LDDYPVKSFVFGYGEFEGESEFFRDFDFGKVLRVGMSGCVKRENSYTTCGGWTSISPQGVPVVADKISVEMDNYEMVIFSKLVKENIWFILSLLRDTLNGFRFAEEYMYLYPLFKIWKRSRLINLPYGAFIKEIPYTFSATLEFHPFKVSLRKKSRYDLGDWGSCFRVENCYYVEYMGRKTLYIERRFRELIGFETYGDYQHPRCQINLNKVSLYQLFEQRLGDLIFLENSDLEFAGKENLEKVEILRGTLKEDNGKMFIVGEDEIILYHKEHGILKLKGGIYGIYRVPYIVRGHD
jgi:hypothetical protein